MKPPVVSAPATAPKQASRWLWVAACAVILLHVVVAWLAREPGLLTGQDDAEYITLSRSLLQRGYNDLFRVDRPPHRTYPPGYPALLAVWSVVFGDSFDTLIALNVVLSAATLLLLFLCVRRLFDARMAVLCVLVVAVSPEIVRFAGMVRSEVPFMFFSMAALYCLVRANGRWVWLGGAIGAALVAALTRSVGVTLVAAIALHWILERRWKLVGVPALGASIALAAWLIWTALGPEQFIGHSYIAELKSLWSGTRGTAPLFERAMISARYYMTRGVPNQLALPTVPGTTVDNIAGVIIAGVCILAGVVVFISRWRPAALYLLTYGCLLAVWLFAVDRFVTPIVPLLLTALLVGSAALAKPIGARTTMAVPFVLALFLTGSGGANTAAQVAARIRCDRGAEFPDAACVTADQASFFEVLRWVRTNLPEDALLLTSKYAPLWLYTGRQVIPYEESLGREGEEFLSYVRRRGAGWILLTPLHNQEWFALAARVRSNCDGLRMEAFFPPRTYIFRIDDDVTPEEAAATCAAAEAYVEAVADLRQRARARLRARH